MLTITGVIGLVLTCAIGIWKMFSRKKAYKRKIANEAEKSIEKANQDGDESDMLDGFNRLR